MKLSKLAAVKLADAAAERARDSHATAIAELQGLPAAGMIVLGDVTIADGAQVLVPHKLGRAPRFVWLSPPRVEFGTPGFVAGGILADISGGGIDRKQTLRILAVGYGATVVVTVAVL
jgi:hypothetical protein